MCVSKGERYCKMASFASASSSSSSATASASASTTAYSADCPTCSDGLPRTQMFTRAKTAGVQTWWGPVDPKVAVPESRPVLCEKTSHSWPALLTYYSKDGSTLAHVQESSVRTPSCTVVPYIYTSRVLLFLIE